MKKINLQNYNLFDYLNEQINENLNVEQIFETKSTVSETKFTDSKNLCPYKIPTIEEIIKQIDTSGYSLNKSKLISDIFECGAIAISNAVDFTAYDEREERYKQIMKNYKPKECELISDIFSKIYALLSSVVYDNGVFNDYLGDLFMRCNQGNKHCGQFFTPYHISHFMAEIAVTNDKVENNEILTINDCCCGAGGMLIAALEVLANKYNVNYAMDCFIDAADIDIRCVHMTYLQLSLAGVPAIIKHQDSLSRKLWSVWKTPAFIMQYPRFCKYENLN